MFKNLFFLHSPFRDFNATDFFERLESVAHNHIDEILYTAVTDPDSDLPLDHASVAIFKTTLDPRCCKAFFRTYPSLAAEERDYYLSKLFQFVYSAITVRFAYAPEALESALEEIPEDLLATAHSGFDAQGLTYLLAKADHPLNSKMILTACNLLQKRRMTPGRAGRTQPNINLAGQRNKLWKEFVAAGGTTKLLCARLGGMDRSQISHWKTGKLLSVSTVTQNIESEIRKFLVDAKDR